jgi:hypothetical protein
VLVGHDHVRRRRRIIKLARRISPWSRTVDIFPPIVDDAYDYGRQSPLANALFRHLRHRAPRP